MRTVVLNSSPTWFGFCREAAMLDPVVYQQEELVNEDSSCYTYSFKIPGFRKRDISISMLNNELIVKAKGARRRRNWYGKTKEIGQHSLHQRILLTPEMNRAAIGAKFRNGVLTIKIPKNSASSGHRIIPVGGSLTEQTISWFDKLKSKLATLII